MAERLFTVEEANALVPRLEIIMAKLQRQAVFLREQLEAVARDLGVPADALTTAQVLERRPHLQAVIEEFQGLLQQLQDCDVQLKGLDLGLVDFPAEIDGERILLCWQYGESEVAYYHAPEAGFGGRKPLPARSPRPTYLQ